MSAPEYIYVGITEDVGGPRLASSWVTTEGGVFPVPLVTLSADNLAKIRGMAVDYVKQSGRAVAIYRFEAAKLLEVIE